MAWRNQQKKPNMSEGHNRFEKFFKKKDDNSDDKTDAVTSQIQFVNKKYDRGFTADDLNSKSSYNPEDKPRNREGGYRNREGGYRNREGGYRNREGGYRNRSRDDNQNNTKKQEVEPYNKLELEIKNIETELNSSKYISQKKRDELTEKLNKLKEDEKNQFPELIGTSNTKVVINSVWGNMSNKIKSTEGVEEANKNARKLHKEKLYLEKLNKEKLIKQKTEIYEEHVESDYDGDDFIDDQPDGWYDEDDL